MSIELDKETRERIVSSIKRYFSECLEQEIGDLKATLLLRFVLQEIGPSIYNTAIYDAQKRLTEAVSEIDGVCFEPEFSFWRS